MNIELAERVIAQIEKEPERLWMTWWTSKDGYTFNDYDLNECGTSGCVAGWTCHLAGVRAEGWPTTPDSSTFFPTVARRLLGISREESVNLFHAIYWTAAERSRPEPEVAIEKLRALIAKHRPKVDEVSLEFNATANAAAVEEAVYEVL